MKILNSLLFLGALRVSFGYLPERLFFSSGLSFTRDLTTPQVNQRWLKSSSKPLQMSSYSMDGSEYASSDSDFLDDDDMSDGMSKFRNLDDEEDDSPTVELQPVPMSKNSGNRFVALLWDKELDTQGRDALDLHYDRIALTEDHVMFCRKASLYNEQFNADSMVDVLWSRQL